MPAADERVSFGEDIKPLFRPMDHESMAWAFDLSSYDEVKEHATAILERLRDGSMPCDGEWPEEQVERFQRWTETGMLECAARRLAGEFGISRPSNSSAA